MRKSAMVGILRWSRWRCWLIEQFAPTSLSLLNQTIDSRCGWWWSAWFISPVLVVGNRCRPLRRCVTLALTLIPMRSSPTASRRTFFSAWRWWSCVSLISALPLLFLLLQLALQSCSTINLTTVTLIYQLSTLWIHGRSGRFRAVLHQTSSLGIDGRSCDGRCFSW